MTPGVNSAQGVEGWVALRATGIEIVIITIIIVIVRLRLRGWLRVVRARERQGWHRVRGLRLWSYRFRRASLLRVRTRAVELGKVQTSEFSVRGQVHPITLWLGPGSRPWRWRLDYYRFLRDRRGQGLIFTFIPGELPSAIGAIPRAVIVETQAVVLALTAPALARFCGLLLLCRYRYVQGLRFRVVHVLLADTRQVEQRLFQVLVPDVRFLGLYLHAAQVKQAFGLLRAKSLTLGVLDEVLDDIHSLCGCDIVPGVYNIHLTSPLRVRVPMHNQHRFVAY